MSGPPAPAGARRRYSLHGRQALHSPGVALPGFRAGYPPTPAPASVPGVTTPLRQRAVWECYPPVAVAVQVSSRARPRKKPEFRGKVAHLSDQPLPSTDVSSKLSPLKRLKENM